MNSVGVRDCNACKEEPELRTLKPIFATEAFPLLKKKLPGGACGGRTDHGQL